MPTTADDRAAIDKAFCLLVELGSQKDACGLTELARRTSMSKTTAHRILSSLERSGAVERSGSAYRLGGAVHRIATADTRSQTRLVETLTPFLLDLHARTRSTAHLGALDGVELVYLNKIRSHASVELATRVGRHAPAYCTAMGKALLACDEKAAQLVAQGPFTAWTPHTITDGDRLLMELAKVRRQGYSVNVDEGFLGLTCVGAPVFGPDGTAVAALSASGQTGTVDVTVVAAHVRAVAAAASRALSADARERSAPARVRATA